MICLYVKIPEFFESHFFHRFFHVTYFLRVYVSGILSFMFTLGRGASNATIWQILFFFFLMTITRSGHLVDIR